MPSNNRLGPHGDPRRMTSPYESSPGGTPEQKRHRSSPIPIWLWEPQEYYDVDAFARLFFENYVLLEPFETLLAYALGLGEL